tara:strand:- start:77 stop:481 length:405 start_codon:yes stop_codon:yes gene_type:complete
MDAFGGPTTVDSGVEGKDDDDEEEVQKQQMEEKEEESVKGEANITQRADKDLQGDTKKNKTSSTSQVEECEDDFQCLQLANDDDVERKQGADEDDLTKRTPEDGQALSETKNGEAGRVDPLKQSTQVNPDALYK